MGLNYPTYVGTLTAGGVPAIVSDPVLKMTSKNIIFGAYEVFTPYYVQYNLGKRAIIKTFLYRFSDMLIRFPQLFLRINAYFTS